MDIELHTYRNDAERELNYQHIILERIKLGLTPQEIADEIWEIVFEMIKDGRLRLEVTGKEEK